MCPGRKPKSILIDNNWLKLLFHLITLPWSATFFHKTRKKCSYFSQLRKQTRERRQYVYAKSLEAQERLTHERKRQLKDALASGKALPTELRKDAQQMGKELAFDEAQVGGYISYHFATGGI